MPYLFLLLCCLICLGYSFRPGNAFSLSHRQRADSSSRRLTPLQADAASSSSWWTSRDEKPTTPTIFHVREWRQGSDDEAAAIAHIIRQAAAAAAAAASSTPLGNNDNNPNMLVAAAFDPEGPLQVDCGSAQALDESYDPSDGSCFLVATTTTNTTTTNTFSDQQEQQQQQQQQQKSGLNNDNSSTMMETIVGTAGLVLGTQIEYYRSGASYSTPAIVTGAIRRVCCWCSSSSSISRSNADQQQQQVDILRALLQEIQIRAARQGAAELILLAYPEIKAPFNGGSSGGGGGCGNLVRPTPALLKDLGFEESYPQQTIPLAGDNGGEAIQFRKRIMVAQQDGSTNAGVDGSATRMSTVSDDKGLVFPAEAPVAVGSWNGSLILGVTFLSLVLGAMLGIANLLGLSFANDGSNRGVGTPLSVQELQQLQQDETLQRNQLDDDDSSSRTWEDLSEEERREEAALMKIIQGEDVRIRKPSALSSPSPPWGR